MFLLHFLFELFDLLRAEKQVASFLTNLKLLAVLINRLLEGRLAKELLKSVCVPLPELLLALLSLFVLSFGLNCEQVGH